MTIKFNIKKYTDPTGKYGDAQTQKNLNAYFAVVADQVNHSLFSKDVTIQVDLSVNTMQTVYGSAGPAYIFPTGGKAVSAIESLMQTGIEPNGVDFDFGIVLSDGFMASMNSQLAANSTIDPKGLVTLIDHEYGHGMGFVSFIDGNTGTKLPNTSSTTFDNFVTIVGPYPYFNGSNALAIYGGPVPLYKLGTPGVSINHISKTNADGTINNLLKNDLMTEGGFVPQSDYVYSDLDLAILKDCGYQNLNTLVSNDKHAYVPGVNTTAVTGTAASDKAVMAGNHQDFNLSNSGKDIISVSNIDNTTIKFTNLDRFQFKDGMVAMDLEGNAGQSYRLYQAAFNRVPDQPGLGYWIGQMDKGYTINQVSASFMASVEFQKLYGTNPSDKTFLDACYSNVLHRTADQAGLDYWTGREQAGMSRSDILASFSESTENHVQVIGAIQHGIPYVVYVG